MDSKRNPVQDICRSAIDVVVLCGGLGTRLSSLVADRPKPMVDINGSPFLDLLIGYVASFGFERFILCTGYRANYIKEYYQERIDWEVVFSEEERPMGTGGALALAHGQIRSSVALVLNGDSFCPIDFSDFVWRFESAAAPAAMVLARIEDSREYGTVQVDAGPLITSFREKEDSGAGLVNAGIYLFESSFIGSIETGTPCSLERDLIPSQIERGIWAYITDRALLDIGTPARYSQALEFFRSFPQ